MAFWAIEEVWPHRGHCLDLPDKVYIMLETLLFVDQPPILIYAVLIEQESLMPKAPGSRLRHMQGPAWLSGS